MAKLQFLHSFRKLLQKSISYFKEIIGKLEHCLSVCML